MLIHVYRPLLLVLLAAVPSLASETVTYPHRDKSIWIGADKIPLPFQEDEAVQQFLRVAEAKEWEKVGVGVNKISKVLLEKDGVRVHAAWRVIDLEIPNFRLKDGTTLRKLRDSCFFEVAAYNLSRRLGLRNIPPAVQRRLRGRTGTLQLWLEDTVPQTQQSQLEGTPPQPIIWSFQNQMMVLFDSLVCNVDRNQGNILIDRQWKIWLIDHSRAFQRSLECKKLKSILHCDREFFLRMKELDEQSLREQMMGLLRPGEIWDLLKRRDKIVDYIENLISERGEGAVLF